MAAEEKFNSPQNKNQMSKLKKPAANKPVAKKAVKHLKPIVKVPDVQLPLCGEILDAVMKKKTPDALTKVYEVLINDAEPNKRTAICTALGIETRHWRGEVSKVLRKHNL